MSQITCPYCRFEVVEPDVTEVCPLCEAVHHSECWVENGGCAVIGCAAMAESSGPSKIVIREEDLDSPSPVGPARTSRFAVPQVGKALLITAIVVVSLAIAAAFYLRSATQQEDGPKIEWGNPAGRQVR